MLLAWGVIVMAAGNALASDWPQWRGRAHDGLSTETGWLTNWPPRVVWSNAIDYGESSVVISEGRLYTMGRRSSEPNYSNAVICLDAATGINVWTQVYPTKYRQSLPDYGTLSTPTIAGNDLYEYDDNGDLYCFDKNTGSNKWSLAVDWHQSYYGYGSSPLVEGDLVILNAGGGVAAVSRTTHEIVWSLPNASSQDEYTSPVGMTLNGRRAVLIQAKSDAGTSIQAINPTNGVIYWSTNFATKVSFEMADPVVSGNRIYVLHYGLLQVAPDMSGVSSVWGTNSPSTYSATPVVLGDYVYQFKGATLACIDLRDNTKMWSTNSIGHGTAQGALTLADGKLIIFASGKLRVAKASPTSFDEGGRVAVTLGTGGTDLQNFGYASPILSNGRIYCRFKDKLVCYQAGPNPPADTNKNGIADGWEAKYFTNTCDSASDSDGDGAPNISEYITGADPTNKTSCLKAQISLVNSSIVVSCPTVAGGGANYEFRSRYYSMEQAMGLTNSGSWQGVTGLTDILGTGETIRLTNSVTASNRYYRVSVRLD